MPQNPDIHQQNNQEKPQRTEIEFNGIKVVIIHANVKGYEQARNIVTQEMKNLGIFSNPEQYLIRQVRATMLYDLLLNGCERDELSYRDHVLENDLKLLPEDYTYAHQFENMERFIRNVSYMIEGSGRTMTVFYKKNMMEPHHEEKYDFASSLGMGATKVTYSFKDNDHKSKAIYAVIVFRGEFEME